MLYRTFTAAFSIFLLATNATHAGDAISERINRTWYAALSAAPTALVIHWDNKNTATIVADAYAGVSGTAAVCKTGVGMDWLDLCAGATGFVSLAGAEQTLTAAVGGGTTTTTLWSVGGLVQAKAHLGLLTLGPYAGVRHIHAEKSTTNALIGFSQIDTQALFGGSELGLSLFEGRGELGLRGEVGRSTGSTPTTQFSYASVGIFARLNLPSHQ